jgi:hypothetical protein
VTCATYRGGDDTPTVDFSRNPRIDPYGGGRPWH